MSQHLDYDNFFNDGRDGEYYEHINRNILDGNVMNMSLIITEGNYGDIYSDYSTCHGNYIIKFSSSPYTLQTSLIIDGQVISFGEILCEEAYFSNQHEFSLLCKNK